MFRNKLYDEKFVVLLQSLERSLETHYGVKDFTRRYLANLSEIGLQLALGQVDAKSALRILSTTITELQLNESVMSLVTPFVAFITIFAENVCETEVPAGLCQSTTKEVLCPVDKTPTYCDVAAKPPPIENPLRADREKSSQAKVKPTLKKGSVKTGMRKRITPVAAHRYSIPVGLKIQINVTLQAWSSRPRILYPKMCVRNGCTFCCGIFKTTTITSCNMHSGAMCHDSGYYPHVGESLWNFLRRPHDRGDAFQTNKIAEGSLAAFKPGYFKGGYATIPPEVHIDEPPVVNNEVHDISSSVEVSLEKNFSEKLCVTTRKKAYPPSSPHKRKKFNDELPPVGSWSEEVEADLADIMT